MKKVKNLAKKQRRDTRTEKKRQKRLKTRPVALESRRSALMAKRKEEYEAAMAEITKVLNKKFGEANEEKADEVSKE